MKAKIIYDLEIRIRKERKQIAIANCKSWTLYYDSIYGTYITSPHLTRAQIKAAKLPSRNTEGITPKVVAL